MKLLMKQAKFLVVTQNKNTLPANIPVSAVTIERKQAGPDRIK